MIKCFGVRYTFHPLFTILILISVLVGHLEELIILFAIVIIHEIGHVAAARLMDWEVKEVQIMPFGGVAVMDDHGRATAFEEIVVALAGPLQNIWMIACAHLFEMAGLWNSDWSSYFVNANLFIAAFNLLPILPLDGGKIVFAMMSYGLSYYRTLIYGNVLGMALSLLLIAFSLTVLPSNGLHFHLLCIGIFLFYSNWMGFRNIPYQFMRFVMRREQRFRQMLKKGAVVRPIFVFSNSTVWATLRLFVREQTHLIYVFHPKGNLQAVLPEPPVVRAALHEELSFRPIHELFM